VSKEEIRNVLLAALEDNPLCDLPLDLIDELADDLMRAVDKNPDDQLTKEEFKKLIHKFDFLLDCFEFDVESIMG
jgi:hypothetical protein